MTETLVSNAEDRVRSLPVWSASIAIEPLKGGLSNESYVVSAAGPKYVVRFGRDFPFQAMQCGSLLREAMWSMVSELHLDAPGADYVAHTAENLERLEKALDQYRSTYGKT